MRHRRCGSAICHPLVAFDAFSSRSDPTFLIVAAISIFLRRLRFNDDQRRRLVVSAPQKVRVYTKRRNFPWL
jgi:hypothetical protein